MKIIADGMGFAFTLCNTKGYRTRRGRFHLSLTGQKETPFFT